VAEQIIQILAEKLFVARLVKVFDMRRRFVANQMVNRQKQLLSAQFNKLRQRNGPGKGVYEAFGIAF